MNSHRFLFFLIILTIISGCNKNSVEKPKKVFVEKPQMINYEVEKLILKRLKDINYSTILVIEKDSLYATKFLHDFYVQKKYKVIFTNKGTLTNQGDTLLNLIKNADAYGLIPADYHYNTIDQLLKTAYHTSKKKYDAVKLMKADLLLTNAFFTLAVDINKGRLNPDSLTREWKGEQLDTNVVAILINALNENKMRASIEALEPKHKCYQSLKESLKNFNYEFKNVDWDSLVSKESDSVNFMSRVKERLIKSHDYAEDPTEYQSNNLVKAIKNFQCKHNLIQDGKIGKLTFKAMQRTKQDYIDQINLNMERWRWKKPPTEKQYVWVNIPKYEMRVIEADTLVMKSRVIVGSPKHQTPILKSTITNFLIYPYWNVPYSIATKEILPILKRDTSYLRKHNFEVIGVDHKIADPTKIKWKWYTETYFPWRLRQSTGDDNALGILKFNFVNKYGVYLHDTDNRRLFGKEMRALSHGCCRLEKFIDFAKFLIRYDTVRYPVDSLFSDLLDEKQKYVYIRKPIAIYLNYYTIEVEKDGEIHYFIDVYGRDEKMMRSLRREKKNTVKML